MTDRAFLAQRGLFEAQVPRYTSYPPATAFGPAVDGALAEGWLRALPRGASLSLYAHVPFCRRLCWFCACRTQGTRTDAPLAPYVATLEREIAQAAACLPAGAHACAVHLGGGTPTILPPALIARVGRALRAVPWDADAEVSVEIDPTVLDAARLDALAEMGMTRASLGVQDFAPAVQAAIGRPQGEDLTREAVEGLHARGVASINFDLLYGLPLQTEASLLATLDAAVSMGPTRIALYGYAHVPWAARRQVMIDASTLPGGPERLELFEAAEARLLAAGFARVGIDHFARPGDPMHAAARDGTLRRNFQGYTVDGAEALVGFGASAISRLPEGYAQNHSATAKWATAVEAGRRPAARGYVLTAEDRLRGEAIERLLCDLALVPARLSDRAAGRAFALELLAEWPEALVPAAGGAVALRPEAYALARMVAATLDRHARAEGRHSAAV